MKCFLYLLLVASLASVSRADSLVYMRVDKQLIGEHLKLAHDGEADRVRTLRNLFHKSGCRQVLA